MKEHEMHHRAQLMLVERIVGSFPILRGKCRSGLRRKRRRNRSIEL